MLPAGFKKTDITPILSETRINRVRKNIKTIYELYKGERLCTFKFEKINGDSGNYTFQYAFNDDENWYSEFDDYNTLHFYFPLGQNRLLVRGIDKSKKKVTNNFEIKTFSKIPFAKKPWFWPISFILFTFPLIFYVLRKRFDQKIFIYKEKLALELQRNKMLSDLHDDVGATLSSLQINSAVANQLVSSNPERAKEVLKKIEEQSEKLSENISDIIWSMKPGKDEFMTLSSRIKTFASDIAGSTNMDYTVTADKEVDTRVEDFTLRKNIVLIIKEAVNNAVKYSNASQLAITVHLLNNGVQITVADNGKGMEVNEHVGNGLSNMKKRASELKGTFEIISEMGKGTKIICIMPL